jgi:hypothetical protein
MTPTKTDDVLDVEGAGNGEPPQIELLATGDPAPPTAAPLILNNAYFELTGVNLRCLVKHLEVVPENKLVTITSFCAEVDYPGVTKWHLRVTFHQSFDNGAVYQTLNAAYQNYVSTGALTGFKARPFANNTASATNPNISGSCIPAPFPLLMGDAGAESECAIDWSLIGTPTIDSGGVVATGASQGAPGFFTPTGCVTPANLAALTGLTANPATTWNSGTYVVTADLLAANWNGTAWVAGKHP